jgi:protein TonB
MISDTGKQNWLLWGLLLVSVAIHLVLFLRIAGWHRPAIPVYIELDLRNISKPIQRQIPKPQHTPEPRALPRANDDLKVPEAVSAPEKVPALPALKDLLPMPAPERIQPPKIPEIADLDIATWEGDTGKTAVREAVGSTAEQNTFSTAAYMRQVKEIIMPLIYAEADRRYNKRARKRQIQGRTLVRVIIDHNGEIVEAGVTESSNYAMLDDIALKAVTKAAPFPPPPDEKAMLDIPITFQLK